MQWGIGSPAMVAVVVLFMMRGLYSSETTILVLSVSYSKISIFPPTFINSFSSLSLTLFINHNNHQQQQQQHKMELQFFLFLSMFFTIYLIAYFLVFRNWIPKIRPEASSCIISFFHGTPAVFLASYALFSNKTRGFSSPNTHFENLVLDFSISYFTADLLHYLVFFPHDILFIGHHLATLFVFLTCRYLVSHGAYAVLSLLILAEVTSACQNTWTLASARRHDAEFAGKVYHVLSPPFYAFYSVARGVLGPLFVYEMCVFYISGAADRVIPKWAWISWLIVVASAICVSILWISNLWVQLFRERRSYFYKKVA